MSLQLGDSLVFELAAGSGKGKKVNLVKKFNENPPHFVTVVATVNENGIPNTAPVEDIIAKDERTLFMSLMNSHTTTNNLQNNGRICIEVLSSNDIAIGIRGDANLIKESMNASENMTLWKINVEQVKQDTTPMTIVDSGPISKPRSERAKKLGQELIGEMKEVAGSANDQ